MGGDSVGHTTWRMTSSTPSRTRVNQVLPHTKPGSGIIVACSECLFVPDKACLPNLKTRLGGVVMLGYGVMWCACDV